jgi:ABC-type polysaccharide/polyol phosphate transport system ATPase subunit
VSHDLNTLPDLCTAVAWMERGEVKMLGPCDVVIPAYRSSMARSAPVGAAA